MSDVSWFRLQQEQQVAVFLCLLVVGERSFLQFKSILQVACDFVLLWYG